MRDKCRPSIHVCPQVWLDKLRGRHLARLERRLEIYANQAQIESVRKVSGKFAGKRADSAEPAQPCGARVLTCEREDD